MVCDTLYGIDSVGECQPQMCAGHEVTGDILREDFMRLLGLSARALAREINVPSNRIAAETAILLGERFGASAEFWLNRQTMHDPEEARHRLRRAA
jgi:addiction module HigA family antidote